MSFEQWAVLFLGGGGLTGLLSHLFMRKKDKDRQEIDMIDRLANEIGRLDETVKMLRKSVDDQAIIISVKNEELLKKSARSHELEMVVMRLEAEVKSLKMQLDDYKKERWKNKDE